MIRTESTLNTSKTLPFLLNGLSSEFGTALLDAEPKEWVYSPSTQLTNMLEIIEQDEASKSEISCTGLFSDNSRPTTTSSVAGTTGIISGDSDESNDDEGTD